MDLDYCIFCFEKYNTDNIINEKISNEINNDLFFQTIQQNIDLIKNKKIVIHCNHNYHIGCLVKYHSYKCKEKCISNRKSIFEKSTVICNIQCPLCTVNIIPSDLEKAFDEIYKLNYILGILNRKTSILYIKIKIKKFILSIKKIFTTITIKEIFKYNMQNILYNDLLEIKNPLKIYIHDYF